MLPLPIWVFLSLSLLAIKFLGLYRFTPLPRVFSSLPRPLKRGLTALAFWPSVLCTRVFCSIASATGCSPVRLSSRITQHLVLGVAPVFPSFVAALHAQGVRGVVNLCAEWNGNEALYASRGMRQLYLPTIDFEPPTARDVVAALDFIAAAEKRGEGVYVHCKAGRGRSAIVALAHCVATQGMTPHEADAFVRARRPNIAQGKADLPLWKELAGALAARRPAAAQQ